MFEQEPVDPDNPLLALDNVIVTPHSLCWTDECFHNMATTGLASIVDALAGRCPEFVVNRDVLDHPRVRDWFAGATAMNARTLRSRRRSPPAARVAGARVRPRRGTAARAACAPENTMAAFQRALAIGVTTIETDLAVTKDGVLVLAHDPSLNPDLARGPGGAWLSAKGPPINTLTLAELTRYDVGRINPASAYAKQFPEQQPADGQQIPTLADLFGLGRGQVRPLQHRDQAHADEPGRDARPRDVRAAGGRRRSATPA